MDPSQTPEFNHNFLPHTEPDRIAMLAAMGMTHTDELFADVPAQLKNMPHPQWLPQTGLDEWALQEQLNQTAKLNTGTDALCFLGGGAYNRFIPSVVNTTASRGEFYTAYTPYQPEMSQGTLQVGFEFQTMIAELTGMDAANASVYDGGTAVAEAALMAMRIRKKSHVAILRSVNPQYREILATYARGLEHVTITEVATVDELTALPNAADLAGVIVQQPNYFGTLEDMATIGDFCQSNKALFIVSADPVSLAVLDAPGNYGADIVVGDIQPLGNALAYGGPYGGYMATNGKFTRQLPGRLVGKSKDTDGRPCYTLTLQTREQHIRREKATSNICTNQALNILKATVYLALAGAKGLAQVAERSMERMHQLTEQLAQLPGVSLTFPNTPYGFECAFTLPGPVQPVVDAMAQQGILAGIPLDGDYPEYPNSLLVCCTELTTPDAISTYVQALSRTLSGDTMTPVTTTATTTSLPKAHNKPLEA